MIINLSLLWILNQIKKSNSNIIKLHNQEKQIISLNVTSFDKYTWTWLRNKFAILKNPEWKKELYRVFYLFYKSN
jgi:hypothetical protein